MKRITTITLLATLLAVTFGANTTLADGGDSIGRLFLTPAERARIDLTRANSDSGDRIDVLTVGRAKPIEQIVMNGFVQRSGGPDTVFVNGESFHDERPRADAIKLLSGPDEENRVVVGKRNQGSARLKPGQAWDLRNDQIVECSACAVDETDSATDTED